MTITSDTTSSGPYLTNGVLKTWKGEFRVQDAAQVEIVRETIATGERITVAATSVAGVNKSSFTATYPATPLPTGYRIWVRRKVEFAQRTVFGNEAAYYADKHERAYDLGLMQVLQVRQEVSDAIAAETAAREEAQARTLRWPSAFPEIIPANVDDKVAFFSGGAVVGLSGGQFTDMLQASYGYAPVRPDGANVSPVAFRAAIGAQADLGYEPARKDGSNIVAAAFLLALGAQAALGFTPARVDGANLGANAAAFRGALGAQAALGFEPARRDGTNVADAADAWRSAIGAQSVLGFDPARQDASNIDPGTWRTVLGVQGALGFEPARQDAGNITPTVWRGALVLGNVDNTSDLDKPLSTAATAALAGKQAALGFTPARQDAGNITAATWKTALALNNVSNTSDANKPVSTATATALAGKQATLGFTPANADASNITGSVWRTALTLGNVDNTSDANKPVSTATLAALGAKQDVLGYAPAAIDAANITAATWKTALALNNVSNTSDANKPISTATATALAGKQATLGFTPANVDASNITATVWRAALGLDTDRVYKGAWNAATNTPTIPAAGSGNKNWYYIVSEPGSSNIGGITTWELNDTLISNGTAWERIRSSSGVASVAGRTGVVVLTKADVALANVDNTSDANKPVSTATATALAGKQATLGFTPAAVDAANITPATWRGVLLISNVDNTSDANKPISTATATALAGKQATIGFTPARQDAGNITGSTWRTALSLNLVDNTADADKPISTAAAAAISAKQDALGFAPAAVDAANISATTWRTALSIANVDNTSDANKPVSTATATALAGKQATLGFTPAAVDAANITPATWRGAIGLGNVSNTADAAKPVSTAQAAAIALKLNATNATHTGILSVLHSSPTDHGSIKLNPGNTSIGGYVEFYNVDGNRVGYIGGAALSGAGRLRLLHDPAYATGYEFTSTPFVGANAIYHVGNKPTKADVGLSAVDNTADAAKPVSTAQAAALAGKQDSLGFTPANISGANITNPTAFRTAIGAAAPLGYTPAAIDASNITPATWRAALGVQAALGFDPARADAGNVATSAAAWRAAIGAASAAALASPMAYGATGNGTAADATAYAAADAFGFVYLEPGKIFNLGNIGNNRVTNGLVSGPGQLKMNNTLYSGFNIGFDPQRSNFIAASDQDFAENSGFVGGSKYTVAISPSGLYGYKSNTGNLNRVTFVGAQGLRRYQNIDRCEGFGCNVYMYTDFAERCIAIGTNAAQWGGCSDPVGTGHPVYTGINEETWDYDGLETANPGIRAKILAIEPVTGVDGFHRNTIIGRDSGGGVRNAYSTVMGYRALGSGLSNYAVTAIGVDSLRSGVLLKYATGLGYEAGFSLQEGTEDYVCVFGARAARGAVTGGQFIAIGGYAGSDYRSINKSVIIGFGAANDQGLPAGSSYDGVLAIATNSGVPLISGNFLASGGNWVGPTVGVNINPADIKGRLHVRTGAGPSGVMPTLDVAADDIVVDSTGNTGMTLVAGTGASRAQYYMSAPGFSGNYAGLGFSFATRIMVLRVEDNDRVRITSTGIGFNGAAAIAKPTLPAAANDPATTQTLANAVRSALIAYGLAA